MWDQRKPGTRMANIATAALFIFAIAFLSALSPPASASSAEMYYSMGQKYMEKGDFDMAALGFGKAVELMPGWPEAHNALGMAYVEILRFRDAVDHFNKAIALKPDYNEARINRRKAMTSVERYEPMKKSRLSRWHKAAILGGVTATIALISAIIVYLAT